MDIKKIIVEAGDAKCKVALEKFLEDFLSPAFGSKPKGEIELAVLNLLISIGAISKNPSSYELASALKITKQKARTIIYNQELRTRTHDELDQEIRILLMKPVIQRRRNGFAMMVESPLVLEHMRAKLQMHGHFTDGSFSPNVVTLNAVAMASLIEFFLSGKQKKAAEGVLRKAGAKGSSLSELLTSTLEKLVERYADDARDAVINGASDLIVHILDGTIENAQELIQNLFL
jgi:hypothetical protein